MQERRRFVRMPEEATISYKILPDPKIEMFFTKDISQGGIRFFVSDLIPENSLIEIRLTISKIPFSFKAVVKTKWIKKEAHGDRYEIGVEFVNLSKEATEHLVHYIQKALNKPAENS